MYYFFHFLLLFFPIITDLMKPDDYLRHIAYDSVIFGFSEAKLKVLIMKYHNTGLFALPGGFVGREENLNDAVKAGLRERTGLDKIYLEQFYTFGDVSRYKPEVMQTILEATGKMTRKNEWMLDRFVSVAYYALINYHDVVPKPDALSDSCDWYEMDKLPRLMLDHGDIVAKALQTLRENLERKLVGVNLLPRYFTMKELQNIYEVILGEKLHRGTFQKKMLGLGILRRHDKRYSGGAHKAPYLYSFRKKRF
jgi:ADP-ribose pyrophosphatase YjhB (NUDIX family)